MPKTVKRKMAGASSVVMPKTQQKRGRMAGASPSNVYQFKITLQDIRPQIWRRIQVPENYNFYELHSALRCAMGWFDSHNHMFTMMNPKTGQEVTIGMEDTNSLEATISESAKISDYFSATNPRALHEYDFGDSWEHLVVLEKILPADPKKQYPRCLAGKRACPPEDCGGIPGYKRHVKILANPQHKEYDEHVQWLDKMGLDGSTFDPAKFDPDSVEFCDPAAGFRRHLFVW